MWKPEIQPGAVFGRWTVVRRNGSNARKERLYLCRCQCGAERDTTGSLLVSGQSTSCGCRKRDIQADLHTTHGQSESETYRSWHSMLQRCSNPNNPAWGNYGGRGVTVHPPWLEFSAFLADMGARPPGKTLERVDNDGPYHPDNCTWATKSEQQLNRRVVKRYTYQGVTGTVGEIASQLGLTYMQAWHRTR